MSQEYKYKYLHKGDDDDDDDDDDNNNNKATLASYYRDYSKIMSMVIRKANIIEHDKLILNSHNKIKSTRVIINKESGRNKKKK